MSFQVKEKDFTHQPETIIISKYGGRTNMLWHAAFCLPSLASEHGM